MTTSTLEQLAATCAAVGLHKISSGRLAAIWLSQAAACERYRAAVDEDGLSELANALQAHALLYRALLEAIPSSDGDTPAALMWAHADVLAVTRSVPDLTIGWLAGIRRVVRADHLFAELVREQAEKTPALLAAAHLVAAVEESANAIDDQIEELKTILQL